MAAKKNSGWGGVRPGSGRPRGSTTTEGWKVKSIGFRPSTLLKIDSLATEAGESRNAFVNRAIDKEIKAVQRAKRKQQDEQ